MIEPSSSIILGAIVRWLIFIVSAAAIYLLFYSLVKTWNMRLAEKRGQWRNWILVLGNAAGLLLFFVPFVGILGVGIMWAANGNEILTRELFEEAYQIVSRPGLLFVIATLPASVVLFAIFYGVKNAIGRSKQRPTNRR